MIIVNAPILILDGCYLGNVKLEPVITPKSYEVLHLNIHIQVPINENEVFQTFLKCL